MNDAPILIIGGGLAGLFTALKLSPRPALVLSPRPLGEGASSAWAQGGIAAALADGDTPEKHTADTVAAGAGLVDADVVLGMAREARDRVHDLLAYGVPFDRDLAGHLVQSREAAHSERRIVRVNGDRAGKAIMEALITAVRATPSITVIEGMAVEDFVLSGGRVVGVIARREGQRAEPLYIAAPATVLATGGIGNLYALTTNPPEAKGIGLAIAARAGAVIGDPEFVQFHPTAIAIDRDPAPLATEALRGEGATLVNARCERFMMTIHKDAELAPRDIVARAVFAEIAAGRGAFLDTRQAVGAEFPKRFPTVYAACRSAAIDPVTELIPVAPAEHYHMGGVATDARGQTSVPGLWAAGEVASTGVHGANRLASNSLLEAIVFGARIADDLRDMTFPPPSPAPMPLATRPGPPTARDAAAIVVLRGTMHTEVGVRRSADGLARAIAAIEAIRAEAESATLLNMATTALIVATAAYARQESRGGHERLDHPATAASCAHRTMTTLAAAERLAADLAADRAADLGAAIDAKRRAWA